MYSFTNNIQSVFSKKPIFLLNVILFVITTIVLVYSFSDIKHSTTNSSPASVETLKLKLHSLKPQVNGHGVISSNVKSKIKSEVGGKITYLNPSLRSNNIIHKGDTLVKIDVSDDKTELRHNQLISNQTQSKIEKLQQQINLASDTVDNQTQQLTLITAELYRFIELSNQNHISTSELEALKQKRIQLKQKINKSIQLKTSLVHEKNILHARSKKSEIQIQKLTRKIDKSIIVMPYDGLINDIEVELGQYININDDLFTAISPYLLRIKANIPINTLSRFSDEFISYQWDRFRKQHPEDYSGIIQELGLTARVRTFAHSNKALLAKVEYFSDSYDLQYGVYITLNVKDNVDALSFKIGTPVQVTLIGKPKDYLIVPRFAVHNNMIYRVQPDNTLLKVPFTRPQYQGNLALSDASETLQAGDNIVVSDLFPATNGMLLSPSPNQELNSKFEQWIQAQK